MVLTEQLLKLTAVLILPRGNTPAAPNSRGEVLLAARLLTSGFNGTWGRPTNWVRSKSGITTILAATQRGIRQLDIYVSNVVSPGDPEVPGPGNGDNWTHWATDAILLNGPGTGGYTGFDLETVVGSSLPTSDIRYVRFEVDSTFRSDGINLGGGTGDDITVAALAQIEFYSVPEPNSYALMALGVGGLFAVRRFRTTRRS